MLLLYAKTKTSLVHFYTQPDPSTPNLYQRPAIPVAETKAHRRVRIPIHPLRAKLDIRIAHRRDQQRAHVRRPVRVERALDGARTRGP